MGFQKTGTSSLAVALERLGYAVTNVNRAVDARIAAGDDPQAAADAIAVAALARPGGAGYDEGLSGHDALQDSPGPFVVEALDRAYPGSKFILTHRPFEKWIASYARFFPDENNALRAWMYGVPRLSGHEDAYRAVYEGRNAAIRARFAGRPGDFLEMDLSAGAGWHDLVAFLGPDLLPRFPHANAGGTMAQAQGRGGGGLVARALRKLGA